MGEISSALPGGAQTKGGRGLRRVTLIVVPQFCGTLIVVAQFCEDSKNRTSCFLAPSGSSRFETWRAQLAYLGSNEWVERGDPGKQRHNIESWTGFVDSG
jgi:hypothetical protein